MPLVEEDWRGPYQRFSVDDIDKLRNSYEKLKNNSNKYNNVNDMCVLTKFLHLCGHDTGETEWEPADPTACPLAPGSTRCRRPRVRTRTRYSYCTGSNQPRGRVLSHCRRRAFREEGWLCHSCSMLNVPGARANCLFAFVCATCGTKDSPLSRLPRSWT